MIRMLGVHTVPALTDAKRRRFQETVNVDEHHTSAPPLVNRMLPGQLKDVERAALRRRLLSSKRFVFQASGASEG